MSLSRPSKPVLDPLSDVLALLDAHTTRLTRLHIPDENLSRDPARFARTRQKTHRSQRSRVGFD